MGRCEDKVRALVNTIHTTRHSNIKNSSSSLKEIKLAEILKPFWTVLKTEVDCVWKVMAHAQKPDFVFWRNGRVHLNRQGRQFSRLLAAKVCASAVVMLHTPSSEVVWRVLATHSIHQFPLHFPSRASPCAITFQLNTTTASEASVTTSRRGVVSNMTRSSSASLWERHVSHWLNVKGHS